MPGLEPASKRYRACQGQLLLVWGLWALERFGESAVRVKASHLCGGASWVGGGLRESPERAIGVSHSHGGRVGTGLCLPSAIGVGGGLNKGRMAPGFLLPQRSPAPRSARTWKSVQLLPVRPCPCQAAASAGAECEQVNLCAGPLRGCLGLQHPSLSPSWTESPLGLTARCEDWAGEPRVGLGPLAPQGGLPQLRRPSWFLTAPRMWGLCVPCLHPSYQPPRGCFISLVTGLLFSSSSGGSQ